MTTLSKLKEEGREEFEEKFCVLDDKLEFLTDWSYYDKTLTLAQAVQAFLTAQIEKAYLAALSDVEKGLPKEKEEIDIDLSRADDPSYIEGVEFNEALSAVKEVIKKLREKNE